VYLVQHQGHLVEKATLMSALWPDATVEEWNLTYNISTLRKVFAEAQDEAQFIETVPTRGYRFIAPVVQTSHGLPVGTATRSRRLRGVAVAVWVFAGMGVAVLLAGFAVWTLNLFPLSAPRAVVRVAVTLPADEELVTAFPVIAVSPNGAHFVYVARRRGVQQLHLRSLDSLAGR
jgi:Transcriptional regulatory protein, C terminal